MLDFVELNGGWQKRYQAAWRPRFLEFCVREAIAPTDAARAIERRSTFVLSNQDHLAHKITADWSLRFTWLAWRLQGW
jgi:hypothetical protein